MCKWAGMQQSGCGGWVVAAIGSAESQSVTATLRQSIDERQDSLLNSLSGIGPLKYERAVVKLCTGSAQPRSCRPAVLPNNNHPIFGFS